MYRHHLNKEIIVFKKRVQLGIAFLDDMLGGRSWRRRIKLRELDLSYDCSCILGQLHIDYEHGRRKLGLNNDSAQALGFYLHDTERNPVDDRYKQLTKEWKQALRR